MPALPNAASTPAPDRRLRLHSRLLSVFFLILFVLLTLLAIVMVGVFLLRIDSMAAMAGSGFAFNFPYETDPWSSGVVPISHFAIWQSLLITLMLSLRLLPGLFILWHLHVLFGLYARGSVFGAANALQVRLIAFALLAYALVPLVTHATLYLARISTHAFAWEIRQLDALVAGLVLLTVARVMLFGHEIERDREGFV
ncbi:MAG: hypothetical protein ACRYGI_08920 [Janthinobacterium lividum]